MKRPNVVTGAVLANTILLCWGAVVTLFMWSKMTWRGPLLLGIICLFHLAGGLGLVSRRNWARRLSIGLFSVHALNHLASLSRAARSADNLAFLWSGVFLAVALWLTGA